MLSNHVRTQARTASLGRNRILRRPLYVGVSLLMAIIALAGFWPTYFGPLTVGRLEQPPLIHFHAVVFVGWLVLFLAQTVLAATGRISSHLTLGRIGIGYGVLLVVVGIFTGISRSADLLRAGSDGGRLLFVAIADMVVFSGFFGAAIAFRRKPQIHKRLMVVAATMLLVAATARMSFLPAPPWRLPVWLAIWFSPVLVAMAYDFMSRRVLHPAYVAGLAAFLIRAFSPRFIVDTTGWSAFTRWLTALAGS